MKKQTFALVFLLILFLLPFLVSAAPFDYTPLENIPGSDLAGPTDFYVYVQAIYKFGIWAVGIVAMFMIIWGGYAYITSAGNNSQMETAKRIITDAIIGLIMALTAYLLLYIINPDLVQMKKLTPVAGVPAPGVPGACQPTATGPCSVDNLKNTCFGNNAEKASAICRAESGGSETIGSSMDKCQPGGEVVSWGLFQINISAHKIGGYDCPPPPPVFDKTYTGSNKNCQVTDQSMYNNCVSAAKNASTNIQKACEISNNGTSWSAWGANKQCGF